VPLMSRCRDSSTEQQAVELKKRWLQRRWHQLVPTGQLPHLSAPQPAVPHLQVVLCSRCRRSLPSPAQPMWRARQHSKQHWQQLRLTQMIWQVGSFWAGVFQAKRR
jgi:hypothetical protein